MTEYLQVLLSNNVRESCKAYELKKQLIDWKLSLHGYPNDSEFSDLFAINKICIA